VNRLSVALGGAGGRGAMLPCPCDRSERASDRQWTRKLTSCCGEDRDRSEKTSEHQWTGKLTMRIWTRRNNFRSASPFGCLVRSIIRHT
jgi:hypothetical protein